MPKTFPFNNTLSVPAPGFGAMGLSFGLGSNLSLQEAEPVLLKALELGCTFWDTAVCFLPRFRCYYPSIGKGLA
jgi:aryl-alcohol dehydrogenase-like predicted oxidoreductase